MQICIASDCTGCFACMNVCPKNAITPSTDEMQKTIPQIDSSKCVNCGLCKKICPAINTPALRKADHAYAVWSKDERDKRLSSSGGAAAVLAKKTLDEGGYVFGSAVTDGKAKSIYIDRYSDFDKLRGSKYVQSETGFIYREAEEKLRNGAKVLFIGTPCQVAGLKAYLRKDHDNLVTVDLICHGVPPHRYLEEHIASKLHGRKYTGYSFRGKHNYSLCVYNTDELIYKEAKNGDYYYTAFYDKIILRDNCYSCKYARPDRISDITIGDFWGLDNTSLKNQYQGRISLLLTNTAKGEAYFKECAVGFIHEERSFEEAANPDQGCLLHPSSKPEDAELFRKYYPRYGFEKAVKKTSTGNKVRIYKLKNVKRRIKNILTGRRKK